MKLITFITRLANPNINIQKIYDSIKSNFNNYYWLIYIEKNTIPIPKTLLQIEKNDNNVIINNEIKRKSSSDLCFCEAIQNGFNSEYAKNSNWIYILDHDNIVHENLKNILNKVDTSFDIILNNIENVPTGNPVKNVHNINAHNCVCRLDWANAVFSSKFFQEKIHHVKTDAKYQDGEFIKLYFLAEAKSFQSNEFGAYYNYLRD